jgi:biotin transport system substrate-specific component
VTPSADPSADLPGRSSRRLPAADLALVAVFAALIAALGLPGPLHPFGGQVPITAQTLGVMLAGSVLGARRGALAVLTFLVLVAAGLPLLAGGRGGLGVFAGPSAGFLIGWVPGAWVTGRLVELARHRFMLGWAVLANLAGGVLVVYALGIPVMAERVGLSLLGALRASWVFVPGDVVKAVLAALVAQGVHRGYPVLLQRGRAGSRS